MSTFKLQHDNLLQRIQNQIAYEQTIYALMEDVRAEHGRRHNLFKEIGQLTIQANVITSPVKRDRENDVIPDGKKEKN